MTPSTTRSKPKSGKTSAVPGNGAAISSAQPKPVQFKFIEQYSTTGKDGHLTGLSFNPSSKDSQNDPFIINTPSTTKTDPNVRRFIRSHVMRGKNKKTPDTTKNGAATPRPSKQRSGELAVSARTPKMDCFILRHSCNAKNQATGASSSSPSLPGTRQVIFSQWMPKPVGSNMSFIQFAEPLPSSKVNLLITAINYWSKHMYPLSMCVTFDDVDNWIEYLCKDRAYVNSVLFAAQCVSEALENRGPGREATVYLSKTLKCLQNNLNNKKTASTDASIAVVLVLIMTACGYGDIDEVGHHIGGLKHMIQLRGGVTKLVDSQIVQLKACRVDISYALEKGEGPTLFSAEEIEAFWDQASHAVELREAKNSCPKVKGVRKKDAESRQWRWSTNTISDLARGAAIIPEICNSLPYESLPHPNFIGRLTSLFDDLYEFCDACNLAPRTVNRVPSSRFKDILISTQYRISRLEAQHTQDLNEGRIQEPPLEIDILRVGMLAFGIVTFLHAEAVSFRYSHVVRKVQACLDAMSSSLSDILQHHAIVIQDPRSAAARASLQRLHLYLWFLFVIHVSTFVSTDNEDLVVGLVSDIFIAIGLKSSSGGALPAFQRADPIPPYNSSVLDMLSVSDGSYPSTFRTSATMVPSTFSATSHSSSPSLDGVSLQPDYSYPPPPSSTTSADGWQPNTPPEQRSTFSDFSTNQKSRTPSVIVPEMTRNEDPSYDNLTIRGPGVVVRDFAPHYPRLSSPDGNTSSTSRKEESYDSYFSGGSDEVWKSHNNCSLKGLQVYKAHVALSNAASSQGDQSKDGPPLLYIWDILKDHLWVDWVHRASGKVLAYKAFALGFGGYPLGQPDQGYPGAF